MEATYQTGASAEQFEFPRISFALVLQCRDCLNGTAGATSSNLLAADDIWAASRVWRRTSRLC